jgi:hypothetical protein
VSRLLQRDEELLAFVEVAGIDKSEETFKHDDRQMTRAVEWATLKCRAPDCGAAWELQLKDGCVPLGWRNSLLQHAQKHAPGRRSRRLQ